MSKTRLTPREQGVLEMHEAGYPRRDIGASYGITRGMVDLIVTRAKRKLDTCEKVALQRANALLRDVLGHADCSCENDDDCPCVRAANYLAGLSGGQDDGRKTQDDA